MGRPSCDPPQAEIIAVGSELLTPSRLESNSLFLSARLLELGLRVRRKTVVGDRPEEIAQALEEALGRSSLLFFSGGLGPTDDDLTREAVAGHLGRELRLDRGLLHDLEERYRAFGREMSENNRRQAQVPRGATVLANPNGTAPGLMLEERGALIFLLPGPPRELEPMMRKTVCRILRERLGEHTHHFRLLRVASESESEVDARISETCRSFPGISTTILSSPGLIDLYFHWEGGEDQGRAQRELEELAGRVRGILGTSVFAEREVSLEEEVGRLALEGKWTLATAESSTGGLVGKMLTDVPGSSRYYLGGVVAYSNALKEALLGVDPALLERFGAVSKEVAAAMARGVGRQTGARAAISLTGVAGPGGGSPEKPVGTVFVGLALEDEVRVRELHLPGNREAIRLRAARLALDLLRRAFLQA